MKKEPGFLYRIFLGIGDIASIIFAFSFAYYFRIHFDPRPHTFVPDIWQFITTSLFLLPIWIVIISSLGLYSRRVIRRRALTIWRLFLASIIGMMTIITYDYFACAIFNRDSIFPGRIVAVYAGIFCFVSLLIMRSAIAFIRRIMLNHNHALIRTLVVGDSNSTTQLLAGVTPDTGFRIVGAVTKEKYLPEGWSKRNCEDIESAISRFHPDAIIHTGGKDIEKVNKLAIENHALYYYSPPEDSIIAVGKDVEWLATTPIILISVTPLYGGARIYKRLVDLILGIPMLIVASPFMLIIWIAQKISEPSAPAIYRDTRLTKFNREFKLLKFRSIKVEYSGMTPEEAFEKMGKPALAEKYRKQGDALKNDPRYTKLGNFLRRTSLDELPQLINVVIGDISLIGPRALQPGELKNYGNRGLILSVKSGLTGLAQVSGRRNISFNERRALDIYYVQNWTPIMDIQILFRTIACVLKHDGAK